MPDHPSLVILFADVTDSTSLYESRGDEAAHRLISEWLKKLVNVAERHGGELVKFIGDEIMVKIPDVEGATLAAIAMQTVIVESPLSIKIGFHFDEVIETNGDVFGDGVNIASRLVSVAKEDEIVTSKTVFDGLSELLKSDVRHFDTTSVKGRVEPIAMYQVIWHKQDDLTEVSTELDSLIERFEQSILRLSRGEGEKMVIRSGDSSFSIGRNRNNRLVVNEQFTSGYHGRIEPIRGRFEYVDLSLNGTFVVRDDNPAEPEFVKRGSITLIGSGKLILGQNPDQGDAGTIEFEVVGENEPDGDLSPVF